MSYANEINMALFIVIGLLALSLFTVKLLKVYVSIGILFLFIWMVFVVTENLTISFIVALLPSILILTTFDLILKIDMHSAILLVALAVIGFVFLVIFLMYVFNYYSLTLPFSSDVSMSKFVRDFVNSIKAISGM